jgi:uncharacterized protein YllA (UPF0747 family)
MTRIKNIFKSREEIEKEHMDFVIKNSLKDIKNTFDYEMTKFELKKDNSSQETIKPITLEDNVASSSKITSDVENTLLTQDYSDHFERKSKLVLNEINHFCKQERN